jgi:hypothetical protein
MPSTPGQKPKIFLAYIRKKTKSIRKPNRLSVDRKRSKAIAVFYQRLISVHQRSSISGRPSAVVHQRSSISGWRFSWFALARWLGFGQPTGLFQSSMQGKFYLPVQTAEFVVGPYPQGFKDLGLDPQ